MTGQHISQVNEQYTEYVDRPAYRYRLLDRIQIIMTG
jgi:hypothetical protein